MTAMNSNIALKIKPDTDNSEVEFYRAGTVIGGAKIILPTYGFYSLDVFGFSRLDPPELQWGCGRYSGANDCVIYFRPHKNEAGTRNDSEELLVNIRLREDLGDIVFKELGETQVGIQANSRTNPKIVGDLWSKLVWSPNPIQTPNPERGSLPYPDNHSLETRDMIQICGFAGITQPVVYRAGERDLK